MVRKKTAKKLAEEKKYMNQAFVAGLQSIFKLRTNYAILEYFQINFEELSTLINQGEIPKKMKKKILSEMTNADCPKQKHEIKLFVEKWGQEYKVAKKQHIDESKTLTPFHSRSEVSDAITKALEDLWDGSYVIKKRPLLKKLQGLLPLSSVKLRDNLLLFFDTDNIKRDFFEIPDYINLK